MPGALKAGGEPRAAARIDPHLRRDASIATLAPSLFPAAVAGGLAILAVAAGWRGSDLPAHLLRMDLVERDGFEVWNNFWYGGHHTAAYGFAFAVLSALVGIWTVAVASAALSAFVVDRLIVLATGRRNVWASLWFAAGTLTNVAIGRLPFALGMTFGLLALLAALLWRPRWAVVAAIATGLASPVASTFLAVIFTAWAIVEPHRRRSCGGLAAASLAPVLVVAFLYPQGGTFGFEWPPLLWTLTVCAILVALVPPQHNVVRASAVVYAVAAAMTFAVPNPLGSNIVRLGMYAAGPVLLALVPARRVVLVALVPPLLWWQWSPAIDAMTRAGADPSTTEAFYAPLRRFLHSVDADTERIEVVPTFRHWEAVYVAADLPLARGWERQLDRRFNPVLYEPGLTADEYRAWLLQAGVRYVALPAAQLDYSGEAEAALLEREQPFLIPVFHSANWQVWEVVDSTGLVDGAAELIHVGTEVLRVRVLDEGDVVVRVHTSAYWASEPALCIEATPDDWIVVRDAKPGVVELFLDETNILQLDDPCEPP